MKKKTILTLLIGLIGLSSFTNPAVSYEQLAFDYFVSRILATDFKHLSEVEFKGETEATYSTLGNYKFCLKPEEKLQSLIKAATKDPVYYFEKITYNQVKNITITNLKDDSKTAKLFIYHSVRVADNYYVFLAIHQSNEQVSQYVVELNVDGEVVRYCRMA
ncbi:MAG TPA: hypothetical protein VF141_05890 [Chryseolinea sp.]